MRKVVYLKGSPTRKALNRHTIIEVDSLNELEDIAASAEGTGVIIISKDGRYWTKKGNKIYVYKPPPPCDCCITVSYSYPEYAPLTRMVRERYLKNSKLYKPLKDGYNMVSHFLVKRGENSMFWRCIIKHVIARPIVKSAQNIRKPQVVFYICQLSPLFAVFITVGLLRSPQ